MVNKRLIEEHSDRAFIRGFRRCVLIDFILESFSWEDFRENIKKLNSHKDSEELLFNEFKFYNLVKKVEQSLADVFMFYLIKNDFLKVSLEDLKKYLFNNIKRYRKDGDVLAAINEIEQKISECGEEKEKFARLLNPDTLFYVSGMWLGSLIFIIREFTEEFDDKQDLLSKLNLFNDYRTDIFHNTLTSRGDGLGEKIEKGLIVGQEILGIVDNKTEDLDFKL